MLEEPLFLRNPILNIPLAVGAAEVALQHGVSREEQDQWALRSHQRYFAGLEAGKIQEEIQPVESPAGKGTVRMIERDEGPRSDTTIEKLRSLPTVYGSKTVTAGNAPGLNDGASALVLMSKERQKELGISPLARILAYVTSQGSPLPLPIFRPTPFRKFWRRPDESCPT